MRNLFVPGCDLTRESVEVDGADHHHLANVLRMRPGDTVTVLDGAGAAAHGVILAIGKRSTEVSLTGPAPCPAEPCCHITVAQALGKGDKFEQVLQHATEAGASAFIPLLTERTIVRLDARSAEEKRARWAQIAKGAAEQSGRGRIPEVRPAATLTELLQTTGGRGSAVLLHPGGEPLAAHLAPPPPDAALVVIGPEGGFSPAEISAAGAAGALVASLGPYVLRTETAALIAVAQLLLARDLARQR